MLKDLALSFVFSSRLVLFPGSSLYESDPLVQYPPEEGAAAPSQPQS